ncbi:MAG: hypothetical protein R3B72_10965 [Polyangiaceae bacterium]
MPNARLVFIAAPVIALASLRLVAPAPPSSSAFDLPLAHASASATPPPRPPAAAPLDALPREPSDRPTLDEWKASTPFSPTRRSPRAAECRASRVREWIKVHCDVPIMILRQIAGDTEGVMPWVVQPPADDPWSQQGGEVIFPLRPGSRRIVQFFRAGSDGYDFGSEAWLIVEAGWLDEPQVVLR